MEDPPELLRRALGRTEERKFLLLLEDDLLKFFSSRPLTPAEEGQAQGRKPCGRQRGDGAERLLWCCSCCCYCCCSVAEEARGRREGSPCVALTDIKEHGCRKGSLAPRPCCTAPGEDRPSPPLPPPASLLRFPPLSSYHRLLVHTTAQRFGLRSSSASMWDAKDGHKSVECWAASEVISRDPVHTASGSAVEGRQASAAAARIPLLLYADLLPECQGKPCKVGNAGWVVSREGGGSGAGRGPCWPAGAEGERERGRGGGAEGQEEGKRHGARPGAGWAGTASEEAGRMGGEGRQAEDEGCGRARDEESCCSKEERRGTRPREGGGGRKKKGRGSFRYQSASFEAAGFGRGERGEQPARGEEEAEAGRGRRACGMGGGEQEQRIAGDIGPGGCEWHEGVEVERDEATQSGACDGAAQVRTEEGRVVEKARNDYSVWEAARGKRGEGGAGWGEGEGRGWGGQGKDRAVRGNGIQHQHSRRGPESKSKGKGRGEESEEGGGTERGEESEKGGGSVGTGHIVEVRVAVELRSGLRSNARGRNEAWSRGESESEVREAGEFDAAALADTRKEGAGWCMGCQLAGAVQAVLPGCKCVRSVGDEEHFVALFGSSESAAEAASLVLRGHLCCMLLHTPCGRARMEVVSVTPLEGAAAITLHSCAWEVGAPKARTMRLHVPAAARLLSQAYR